MAKAKAATEKRENRIIRYFKETRAELRKVTWPTRQEALNLTGIVLAVTIFMAALLGLLDFLFAKLFALFI
ncbi:MAG: preprotein translocase subunit SecE [Anaerolineae bacterium]|nr:preprotein translocase subunit SecE [Anaerolineae bacterium]